MPTTFFKTIYSTNPTGKPIIHDISINGSEANPPTAKEMIAAMENPPLYQYLLPSFFSARICAEAYSP